MLKKLGKVALFAIFTLSPALGATGSNPRGFEIPVKLEVSTFLSKPAVKLVFEKPSAVVEKPTPKEFLVLPSEVYIPNEEPKEGGGFSCGQPSDAALYSEGVKAFRKGNLKKAESLFKKLLSEYPSSPYTLRAAYLLGVIELKGGEEKKAFKTFKDLCRNPYTFRWKRFACYNAVALALKLKRFDVAEKLSEGLPFWRNLTLWVEGKENTERFEKFLKNYDCSKLAPPYSSYCDYLKGLLLREKAKDLPEALEESIKAFRLSEEAFEGEKPDGLDSLKNAEWKTKVEFYLAEGLILKGKPEEALKVIGKLYKTDGEKAAKLAELLISKYPNLWGEVLKVVPDRGIAEFAAKTLLALGRYPDALKVAERFGLKKLEALALYTLGDYKGVVKLFKGEVPKDKTLLEVYLDSLLRTGDLKTLEETLRVVKEKFPELYGEYSCWAKYYSKRWKEAAKCLRNPLYRAAALLNGGNYTAVLQTLKGESSPVAKLIEARALLAEGKFSNALRVLKGLKGVRAEFLRGLILFAEGKYREAASVFSKIKNYPPALLYLANSYYNLGDYQRAKKLYLEIVKNFKGSPLERDAYVGLVNVYLNTGDPSLAEFLFRKVELHPSLLTEEATLKFAESLIKNGKEKEALPLVRRLLNSSDLYVRAKAMLLMAQLKPSVAEEYLLKAVKMRILPVSSEALERLVELYLKKGDVKRAKALLDGYSDLVSDPSKLAELYASVGGFKKAYSVLKEAVLADNSYTLTAYKIALKYNRPEFLYLSLRSLDPKVATDSAYRLVKHLLERGKLREALRVALFVKLRGVKYEPTYSRMFALLVERLYSKGYVKDACTLIADVKSNLLPPSEKPKLERIKRTCPH